MLGFQSVSLRQGSLISGHSTLSVKDPQPQCTLEPVRLCHCLMFFNVSALTIASCHSAKGRPNQSQWSVLQCFQPQCTTFSVCLFLFPHFLSVSIFILLSVSLLLYPYYLSVSISIFIFCLSPSLSLFSVCLHLNPHFLSVFKDRDRQKLKIELETKRKCIKGGERQKKLEKIQTDNENNDGDKKKMRIEIKTETDRHILGIKMEP